MRSRTTWIALIGAAAWGTLAIVIWIQSAPLGHDESQYALSAQDSVAGAPARWFYLSRGMNAVAIPGILLGGSEMALRFVPMLLGFAYAGAAYLLARRVAGPLTAAWVVVVLAASYNIVRWSTELLSDMPAAALLIAALAIIVEEVDRENGARYRIVLAAPLLAAAQYVRYGSAVPIAVIVAASLVVGWRAIARRPLPILATAGIFLLCMLPHFIHAQRELGSPLGILLSSRAVPQQDGILDGLATYVTSNPFKLYGVVTPFVLVASVFALRLRDKRRLLLWLVGVGGFIAMGLTTHGMVRYIFAPITILVVVGSDRIVQLVERLPERTRHIIAAVLLVVMACIWFFTARGQLTADEHRTSRMRGTLSAVTAIRRDTAEHPCSVIGTHYTQLEWYSRCEALHTADAHHVALAQRTGRRVYVIRDFTPTWAPAPQPEFRDFPGVPVMILDTGDVQIARIDPPRS